MEDDGFFGFDTSLPSVRKGPKQEIGDVELEDTYDALNDETFGVINADEDWEEEHEKLAEYLGEIPRQEYAKTGVGYNEEDFEECAYPGPQPGRVRNKRVDKADNVYFETDNEDAANVAASVSQILLDDDDIDNIISRPINYSRMESKLFGQMSPQSSIFDTDIVGSPSTPSIWSTLPSDIRKSSEESPKVIPVIPNGNPIPSMGNHNLLHEGLFKTVEELERHLLHQPKRLTMEELERNLLSNRPLPTGSIRSVEEIEAELTRSQPPRQVGMMPPPPPPPAHLQSYLRLPPPMGMSLPPPPPARAPMPHPVQIPLPVLGTRSNGQMPLPSQSSQWTRKPLEHSEQQSPPFNAAPVSHSNEKRKTFAAGNYDDYNGLMSTKEKQWLMSIQINQLISDNPYVEDYYFTVLRLRCLGKLPGRDSNEGPKLVMHERAKIESRTYAPTQFANSLGKLQVVTYTAPRRIIDVSISHTSPEMNQDPQVAVKDMRKFKQILLDIEKMYVWLLDLEDSEMRVESLPKDAEPGPHHQATIEYQHKLQSFLAAGDRLQQVMLVRKGKILVLRAWNRFMPQFQELIVRTILLNCLILIRRDNLDHVLVRFLPLVNDVLAAIEDLQGVVSMAQLIDAAQKNSGYVSVTSTKMGLDFISLIMCRGTELVTKCLDDHTKSQWFAFARNVGNSLLAASTALKSDLGLLNLEHFQQVGMEESKLSALKIVLHTITNAGQEI
ncbi:protein PAT1 homolog 1 [Daphnia magna]|uniref:PAT1 1 protein n=2 Tax=Daphnia magna TaxID=35525 RepID=A0A164SJN7_9CRUS|nr:protein PAT1 homolog 1 [Daphnia magna]KAK4024961.1 hypothetical protein OUZ56_010455 [Daphnia magna]KZS09692.1 PAT1 1 protein [Daphnia magna]